MPAKIELLMKANTQGAVQNLRATQTNINKVADALVKLQNQGVGLDKMNNAVLGFDALVDRLATDMVNVGDAASFDEARVAILGKAMSSVTKEYKGEFSEIASHIRLMGENAQKSANAYNAMVKATSDDYDMLTKAIAAATEDTQELGKAQKSAASAAGSHGTKLLEVAKNILKFQLLMQPITLAIRTFKQTLSESVEVAAEAEQVFSKLATVFDGMSSAKDTAEDLARSIGTATSTAASALSTVGDLLQAQGMTVAESMQTATEWVQKFADIIAFKDIDMSLEDFAQNFMSGAAGNLRNFRTFGSIVKESAVNARLAKDGLDKLTGSQLELAKMTTRANIALEQQENAMGATNREWESALAIQRRMEEQSKRFKENFGDLLNQGLIPVKSKWTEILDLMNDVAEMQMKLNELTAKNTSSSGGAGWYDTLKEKLTGDKTSLNGLVMNQVSKLKGNETLSDTDYYGLVKVGLENLKMSEEDVADTLSGFGRSVEDISRIIKQVKDENSARAASDAANAVREKYASTYEAFRDSLNGLTGVNLSGVNAWSASSAKMMSVGDINGAIAAMGGLSPSDYADQLSVALGNDVALDGLKAQQKEWASLYEIVRNFYIQNNENHELTEENLKTLDEIKGKYQGISSQIETINNYEKQRSALSGNGDSMRTAALTTGYMAAGEYSEDASVKAKYAVIFENLATTYEAVLESAKKLGKPTEELAEEYDAQVSYYSKLMADELKVNADKRLNPYTEKTADYQKQLAQLGMTDSQKTLDDLQRALTEAGGDASLVSAINESIEAFNALDEATTAREEAEKAATEATKAAEEAAAARQKGWDSVKDNVYSNTGFFGSAVQTFTDGEGDWLSDLITVILKLFEQTDEWTQLIKTIDSILGPVLTAIGAIIDTVAEILIPILDLLLPIIKALSKAFVTIATGIELAWNTIVGLVQTGIGGLVNSCVDLANWFLDFHIGWWYPFGGASLSHPDWADEWASFDWEAQNEETLKEMEVWLAKIDANTLATANNTGNDKYSTYAELMQSKYITPEQYAALVGSNKYSSATTIGGVTMTTGGKANATYITISGLSLSTQISNGQEFVEYLGHLDSGTVAYGVAN